MTASDVEGWDSMSHTRILYECELKWSIRLTLQELSSLKTIGDLLNVLHKKINS
jgi:acyl carrier protein